MQVTPGNPISMRENAPRKINGSIIPARRQKSALRFELWEYMLKMPVTSTPTPKPCKSEGQGPHAWIEAWGSKLGWEMPTNRSYAATLSSSQKRSKAAWVTPLVQEGREQEPRQDGWVRNPKKER